MRKHLLFIRGIFFTIRKSLHFPQERKQARDMSGELEMQEKMKQIFSLAGKELKFFQSYASPRYWIVTVDGKKVGEAREEAVAFQKALDASGIGGKISYTYSEKKSEWVFRYTPKKVG